MYNLNALFNTASYDDDFLRNITLGDADRQSFREARNVIREALRSAIGRVLTENWIEGEPPAHPKFITQGSWAYRTLNAPCRAPQQADLDYGLYLPVRYANGTPPTAAARVYFEAVERILEPVAERHRWQIDSSNGNCVRVIITHDKHIDVPCYVMRREEFERERATNRMLVESLESTQTDKWLLSLLPQSGVLRATRENGWQEDDPRPIFDWWKATVDAKGEQLRRVARYLKAARDHAHWPEDEAPDSLLLMVSADSIFEQYPRRDDKAIAATCHGIEARLRANHSVENPTKRSQDLARKLDEAGIREATCQWLNGIAEAIDEGTTQAAHPTDAVSVVRPRFGNRLPNDPGRIAEDTVVTTSPKQTAKPALAGTVHSG